MTLIWAGREIQFKLSGPVRHYAQVGDLELMISKGPTSGSYFAEGEWSHEWGFDAQPGDTAQLALDALHEEAIRLHAEFGQTLVGSD